MVVGEEHKDGDMWGGGDGHGDVDTGNRGRTKVPITYPQCIDVSSLLIS